MAPVPDPSAPLLNLDTFIERASVVIDGTAYALKNRGELSLLADRRFGKLSDRFNALWVLEDPTPTDEQELARVLTTMCEMVLEAPAEVQAKLFEEQRLAVVTAFIELRRRPASPVGAMATPASPTGASSSLNSSGSTQAAAT